MENIDRNVAIFREWVSSRNNIELAKKHGITGSRISQIVNRMLTVIINYIYGPLNNKLNLFLSPDSYPHWVPDAICGMWIETTFTEYGTESTKFYFDEAPRGRVVAQGRP